MTSIATNYSREAIAHARRQEVACPRCMEPCGWCSDPRWMHGTLKLPGSKRKCTVPGYEPEGADCPVCRGRQRVMMTRTYEAILDPDQSACEASDAALRSDDRLEAKKPNQFNPKGEDKP